MIDRLLALLELLGHRFDTVTADGDWVEGDRLRERSHAVARRLREEIEARTL